MSPSPIKTTVCEGVRDSQRFDGKKVRFFASFQSDGIERSVLTDSKCSRGIVPFVPDEVENHPDIEVFDRALERGKTWNNGQAHSRNVHRSLCP